MISTGRVARVDFGPRVWSMATVGVGAQLFAAKDASFWDLLELDLVAQVFLSDVARGVTAIYLTD